MLKKIIKFTTICTLIMSLSPVKSFSENIQIENKSNIHLYNMSIEDINKLLKNISKKTFVEKIQIISDIAKGTPYFLGPLGEGEKSPYDTHPLIDLTRVDCVTFVEQTLALSMSNDYETAFNNLQKIRYKNSDIKIEKRNHYFMADWVVNNKWFVNDVTKEIAPEFINPLTKTISHKTFFANSVYKGIKAQEDDRTITINYIPKEKLHLITDNLQSGDIVAFVTNLPSIFVSHTGFILKDKSGNIFFRNATSINQKQVVDLPYSELVEFLKNSKKNLGLAFIRPRI